MSPPPGLASSMPAAEAHARGRDARGGTLRTLRELLRALARSPGRKEVVLVSEGFPLDPAQDGFREVRQQAARANAVVHFLDARGLAVGPEFLGAAGSRALPESGDLALTTALWRLESGGTKAIAEETGGRVLQTNDLADGLARVADESRAYYLLGYAPTNDRQDGRYRKLKVEVKRPGLEIRARPGYFAASSKEKREPDPTYPINRAMRDLFDADGIPLRLAVYVMGEAALDTDRPKTGVEVLVAAEVRLDALATEDRGGRGLARPKVRLLTSRIGGEWHESDWSLQMTLEPKHEDRAAGPASPGDAWHPILTRLAVAPGQHRARLVVESGGRVGSVTHDFVVPPFTDERLSTPILSDRLLVERGSRAVLPLARREFPRDSRLHCWVELLGAAEDGTTGMRTATAAFVMRSANGREWASGEASPMRLDNGRPVRLLSVPLAEAPEGESELVLTVRDEVSRQTLEAREPFRVLPPLADRP